MTTPRRNEVTLDTDLTIDRVDNSLGYIKGNVVACCHAANQLKSKWENPNSILTSKLAYKIVNKVLKQGK